MNVFRVVMVVVIVLETIPISGFLEVRYENELRVASAATATALVRATGTTVWRENTALCGPSGCVQVFPPCAGGRVLAVTIACGCVCVALGRAPRWRKLLVLSLLPAAGLFANALRVAILFLTGIFDETFHELVGLACFTLIALVVASATGMGRRKEVHACVP